MATVCYSQGRYEEGLALVEGALADPGGPLFQAENLRLRKAELLVQLQRHDELHALLRESAGGMASQHWNHAWGDFWLEVRHDRRSILRFKDAFRQGSNHAPYFLGLAWWRLGQISRAVPWLRQAAERAEPDNFLRPLAEELLALAIGERGDIVGELQRLVAATRSMAERGGVGIAATSAADIATAYEHLGLVDDAERWRRQVVSLERARGSRHLAGALRGLATLLWALPNREDEALDSWAESIAVCRRALETATEPTARLRLQVDLIDALGNEIARFRADARGVDPRACALKILAAAEQEHAFSPERRGRVAWAGADLARDAGEYALAAERYADILAWAREPAFDLTRRGPRTQADLLYQRANALRRDAETREGVDRTGALDAALLVAHEGVRVASASLSVYRRRDAYRVRAQILDALGRTSEASRNWRRASAVLRAEGLRPLEMAVLHEISERPLSDDAPPSTRASRIRAAQKALTIAQLLARPRDEARALKNLAVLNRTADPAYARRCLDEALDIARNLGPRKLLVEVEALERA